MAERKKSDDDTGDRQGDEAGEDEGGVPKNGDDSGVKEDQKPIGY